MKKFIFPVVLGIVGVAILVSLGNWQVRRLAWKEAILADIEARIAGAPVAIPANPDPEEDRYLPVMADGVFGAEELHVLVSQKRVGPGYRVITPFETDGRRILVDRGFIPIPAKDDAAPGGPATVTGNLHWPDEIDSYTPENDLEEGIWFARDVPTLAETLGTEPILIIARQIDSETQRGDPIPVTTEGIPNDHLEYAVTWYGLALVWAGMTAFLLWRMHGRTE